jgi:hypothetical protein
MRAHLADEAPVITTFSRRILAYVIIDVLVINLIVFWWHQHLTLRVVLAATLLEIVAVVVAMAYWVPKYGLKW